MASTQLFRRATAQIEEKYHRDEAWARHQLSRALELADLNNPTPAAMREILQYEFGIREDGKSLRG